MVEGAPLDSRWLRNHPLAELCLNVDKNTRGRVLAIGGSRFVAGGLILTGEAALRAGAGKLQFATIESAALLLGTKVPEAGVIALREGQDGELTAQPEDMLQASIRNSDCIVVGPAMTDENAASSVLRLVLGNHLADQAIVIDAAAIGAVKFMCSKIENASARVVITPHPGELAALLDIEIEEVNNDPAAAVAQAVQRTNAVVLMKAAHTLVAAPNGTMLDYAGGGPGLATAGSGDVLAGLTAGILARGQSALEAAAWAVWLHGEAGRRLSERSGPVGYLARELPAVIPSLMRAASIG